MVSGQEVGEVAALSAAIVGLSEVIKYLTRKPRNGHHSAGSMSPEFWQIEFRKAVQEEGKILLDARNEKIREIVREELENHFRRGYQ